MQCFIKYLCYLSFWNFFIFLFKDIIARQINTRIAGIQGEHRQASNNEISKYNSFNMRTEASEVRIEIQKKQ